MAPAQPQLVPSTEMTPEEWAVRVDLAAAYRLAALYGWDDGIATHMSVRIPGEEAFLLNPFGLMFEEVTASNLVKIDIDGNILAPSEYAINPAGYMVHSAVHQARHDAGCVIHFHTQDGVAMSCIEQGLQPIDQMSALIADKVGYHDFEGVVLVADERERLGADLGMRNFLMLRNHGTLTVGADVAEAFSRMALFEKACAIQLKALATGLPIKKLTPEAETATSEVGAKMGGKGAQMTWAAYKRHLDRITTDYQH